MTYGIDFGTSNSVVARWTGEETEVLPIDGENLPAQWREPEFEELFPSVMSVRDLQRTLCFGWAAKTTTGEPVDAVKRMLGTRSAGAEQTESARLTSKSTMPGSVASHSAAPRPLLPSSHG